MTDLLIFAAMYGCAMLFHYLEGYMEKRKARARHHIGAVVLACLGSPATSHAVHEFIIHVIVYSGKVIPMH